MPSGKKERHKVATHKRKERANKSKRKVVLNYFFQIH
jgi:hypothetical protein